MKRVFLLAIVVLVLAGLGCSRTVLISDSEFTARQKVVVTFEDGSWIKGKIGLDEKVTLVSNGMVYRARIDNVTTESDDNPGEIIVGDCTFIR